MEKLTTPEFDSWVQALKEHRPVALIEVLRKYNIADLPDGRTIMLAAVKNGDPFINDLNAIGFPPVYLRADGLKGFFEKALGVATTVGAAATIFGAAQKSSQQTTAKEKEQEKKDEETFDLFGKPVPKIYVYVGLAFTGLIGAYLYLRN